MSVTLLSSFDFYLGTFFYLLISNSAFFLPILTTRISQFRYLIHKVKGHCVLMFLVSHIPNQETKINIRLGKKRNINLYPAPGSSVDQNGATKNQQAWAEPRWDQSGQYRLCCRSLSVAAAVAAMFESASQPGGLVWPTVNRGISHRTPLGCSWPLRTRRLATGL